MLWSRDAILKSDQCRVRPSYTEIPKQRQAPIRGQVCAWKLEASVLSSDQADYTDARCAGEACSPAFRGPDKDRVDQTEQAAVCHAADVRSTDAPRARHRQGKRYSSSNRKRYA